MFGGATMKKRYAELIDTEPQKEETRTADQVVDSIKKKLEKLKGE